MIFFVGTLYPNVRTPLPDVSNSQILNLSSPFTVGSRSTNRLASGHTFQTRKSHQHILESENNRPTFSHTQSQETSYQHVVSTSPNAIKERLSIKCMEIVSNTIHIHKTKSSVIIRTVQISQLYLQNNVKCTLITGK